MAVVRIIAADTSLGELARSLLPSGATLETGPADILIAELTGGSCCQGRDAVVQLREAQPWLPVIVISRASQPAITQQAVRLGVTDYYTLPLEANEFSRAVSSLMEGTRNPPKNSTQQNVLLGSSAKITSIRNYISRVAMTDSSVLITGESGTGKELVAESIHKSGTRAKRPFVCVNSAAVPDALFESELYGYEKGAFTGAHTKYQGKLRLAHSGTIFFDEIGDISLAAQAKLLRAIESRRVYPLGGWREIMVDVRVIAATNRDLEAMTRTGAFRLDLLYRLNVVRIEMPPLRELREDIPGLLAHFVEIFNWRFERKVIGFDPAAVQLLQSYDWPGNTRELRNVVEASFVNTSSNLITTVDLPFRFRSVTEEKLEPDDRQKLIRTLLATNWNISRAASELRCSRMTVYRRMAHHQISRTAGGDDGEVNNCSNSVAVGC